MSRILQEGWGEEEGGGYGKILETLKERQQLFYVWSKAFEANSKSQIKMQEDPFYDLVHFLTLNLQYMQRGCLDIFN